MSITMLWPQKLVTLHSGKSEQVNITMQVCIPTHYTLLAVSCSPILVSASLNTLHEGIPVCETLSFCWSHASSISFLQSSGL